MVSYPFPLVSYQQVQQVADPGGHFGRNGLLDPPLVARMIDRPTSAWWHGAAV